MHRRHYLMATGGVATVLWGGPVSADEHEEDEEAANEEDQPAFIPEEHDPEPYEFEGDGSEVHENIEIDGGLTVVQATHDGPEMANFIVELIPEEGEFEELFQNELEPYEGELAAILDADTYMLDVEAEGPWTVDIYQPRADEGNSLPQEFADTTDRVYGPLEFEGSHVATGSHTGEGNYIVEVLPMGEGEFEELVFNEIGQVEDDETTIQYEGLGWIGVRADGDWNLIIE